jgi:hypothetical protein
MDPAGGRSGRWRNDNHVHYCATLTANNPSIGGVRGSLRSRIHGRNCEFMFKACVYCPVPIFFYLLQHLFHLFDILRLDSPVSGSLPVEKRVTTRIEIILVSTNRV